VPLVSASFSRRVAENHVDPPTRRPERCTGSGFSRGGWS
jgi:hypothetical protein